MEHESVEDMIRRQAAARRGAQGHGHDAPGTLAPAPRGVPAGWATFARIAALVVLVIFSWSMGQHSPSELNAFGKLVASSFFLAAPLLYLLPTIEGKLREQPNIVSIAVVNLLLGWTLVGWVVAMAWACTVRRPSAATGRPEPVKNQTPAAPSAPTAAVNSATLSVADEIRKLADLKAQGLLSEDEFAAQKAKVLSR